jgi:hypothetical protein
MTNPDALIEVKDNSAATRNYGKSPYLTFPEREAYKQWRTYERKDGTRYVEQWDCYRWGGSFTSELESSSELAPPEGAEIAEAS